MANWQIYIVRNRKWFLFGMSLNAPACEVRVFTSDLKIRIEGYEYM